MTDNSLSPEVTEKLIQLAFSGMSAPQAPRLRSLRKRQEMHHRCFRELEDDEDKLNKFINGLVEYYQYTRLSSLRAAVSHLRQRREYLEAIWQRRERIHLLLKLQFLKLEVIYTKVANRRVNVAGLYSTLSNANHMIGTEHFSRILSKQHLKQSDPWDGTKYKLLSYHSLYLQLSKKIVLEVFKFQKQHRLLVNSLARQDVTNTTARDGLLRLSFYAILHESIQNRQVTRASLLKTHVYLSNKYLRFAFLFLRRQSRYRKKATLHMRLARTSHRNRLCVSFFKRIYAVYDHRSYRRKLRLWAEETRVRNVCLQFFFSWIAAYNMKISLKADLYQRASKGLSTGKTTAALQYRPAADNLTTPNHSHHPTTSRQIDVMLLSYRRKRFSELCKYLAVRSMRIKNLKVIGGVGGLKVRDILVNDEGGNNSAEQPVELVVEDRLKHIEALYPSYTDKNTPISSRSNSTPSLSSKSAAAESPPDDSTILSSPSFSTHPPLPVPIPPITQQPTPTLGVDESVLLNNNSTYSTPSLLNIHTHRTTPIIQTIRRRSSTPSVLDKAVDLSAEPSLPPTPIVVPNTTKLSRPLQKSSRTYSLREFVFVQGPDGGGNDVGRHSEDDRDEREEEAVIRHPRYPLIRNMFLKFKVQRLLKCARLFIRDLHRIARVRSAKRRVLKYMQYKRQRVSFMHWVYSFNKSLHMRRLADQIFSMNVSKKVWNGWKDYAQSAKKVREAVVAVHAGFVLTQFWDRWRHSLKQSRQIHKQRGKHMAYVMRGVWAAWRRYVFLIRAVKEKGFGAQIRQHRHIFDVWRKKYHQRRVLKNVFGLYQQRWYERDNRYLPSYAHTTVNTDYDKDSINQTQPSPLPVRTNESAHRKSKQRASSTVGAPELASTASTTTFPRSSSSTKYSSEFHFLYRVFHALKSHLTQARDQRIQVQQVTNAYLFRGFALLTHTFESWRGYVRENKTVQKHAQVLTRSKLKRHMLAWSSMVQTSLLHDIKIIQRKIFQEKRRRIFSFWKEIMLKQHYQHPLILTYQFHFVRHVFLHWKLAYAFSVVHSKYAKKTLRSRLASWKGLFICVHHVYRGLLKLCKVLYTFRYRRAFLFYPGREQSMQATQLAQYIQRQRQQAAYTNHSSLVRHRMLPVTKRYLDMHIAPHSTLTTYHWPGITSHPGFYDLVRRSVQIGYVVNYSDSYHIHCIYHVVKHILVYWKEFALRHVMMRKQLYMLRHRTNLKHLRYVFSHWIGVVPSLSFRILTHIHADKLRHINSPYRKLYYEYANGHGQDKVYEDVEKRKRKGVGLAGRLMLEGHKLYSLGEAERKSGALNGGGKKKSKSKDVDIQRQVSCVRSSLEEDLQRYEKQKQAPLLAIEHYKGWKR